MGNRFFVGVVLAASVLGAVACAADGGLADDDADVINYGPSDASSSKDAKVDSATTPVGNDGGAVADATTDADSGKPLDAGDGGVKDADAGDSGGDGGVVSCNATNTCSSATSLGSISGDKGSDVVSKTGYLSGWYKVSVTEDDSQLFTRIDLKTQFSLGSPIGSNYDLYVYDSCSTVVNQSTNLTGTDSVAASWTDQAAHDDGQTLYIYVKYASGECKSSSTWSLQGRGNYP